MASVGFLALSLLFCPLVFSVCSFGLALIVKHVSRNFRRDITEMESCMFLRVENRSKPQVILSDNGGLCGSHQLCNQDLMTFLCTEVEVYLPT